MWESDSTTTTPGDSHVIRYAIGTGATQDSATSIPAGAFVFDAWLEVTTPFSPGSSVEIGRVGNLALLQSPTDNNAQVANIYRRTQDTPWASALPVRTTVTGAPIAGGGFVVVFFSIPLP
jgi:hypothetical protein